MITSSLPSLPSPTSTNSQSSLTAISSRLASAFAAPAADTSPAHGPFSRSLFLHRLEQAAGFEDACSARGAVATFAAALKRPTITNYVLRRDEAGRPTVWRIGRMNRKISYLHSGKIKTLQDTGTLPRLASGRGQHVFLLGFETYDCGRTYIGRLMMGDEIDSVVMTDLYLRNDGTVVATDDSGCEMTWNPNTGDASTEFVQHNLRRETWIDHLDESVTIKLHFPGGAFVEMKGTYEAEFQARSILIKDEGGTIELDSAVSGDLRVQAQAILRADDIRVNRDKESGKTTINC